MSDRLILVTGGAGFLGQHLAQCLRQAGARVRVFDQIPAPAWITTAGIEYVQGDVRDRAAVDRVTGQVSAIVHAAFASPRPTSAVIRGVNLGGTQNILASALTNRVPRLVLVSSTIVSAPKRAHPFLPHAPLSRLDLYRATRLQAETMVSEAAAHGLSVAIVRPQSFLGAGRLGAFGIIFEMIRTGESVPVLGTSSHRYQLLGVGDLAEGIRQLATNSAEGLFSFGADTFGTVRQDFEGLLSHAGTQAGLRHVPSALARAVIGAIELAGGHPLSEWHRHSAWGKDSISDLTRAKHELGWRPAHSNLDALVEAYDWYVEAIRTTGDAPRTHPVPRLHQGFKNLLRLFPTDAGSAPPQPR